MTYANVMATLAVFIALGGGAWAVAVGRNDVGSREIAKNAVGTSELKNNKAKGKDIDESSLGQVPNAAVADRANTANIANTAGSATSAESATSANSATTAANADTVGGLMVKKLNVRQAIGTQNQPVLDLAGLHLTMNCINFGNVSATTTKDNSSIFVWGIYTGINTIDSADQEGADFDLGDTFDVSVNMGGGGFDPDLGTLLYESPDGTVVTVDLVTDYAAGPLDGDDCLLAGTAVGG